MRLINDRVLVKLAPTPDRNPSGIILAEAMAPPPSLGKVVMVGPKCKGTVKAGDVVAFPPEVGEPIDPGIVPELRTPHVIVRELDVMVTVEAR